MDWIPACAGMTALLYDLLSVCHYRRSKQSEESFSNVDCHASGNPPSPPPSPVKGEGDYGKGLERLGSQ